MGKPKPNSTPQPYKEADVYERPTASRVGNWIKDKIRGDPEIRQTQQAAERKGRLERAEREGYARGVGSYATKKERGDYGIPEQQRSGGARPGFRSTMKRSDDIFGWSGSGGGIGLGFGDEPRKQVAPPMRKTVYNPRTGKVETYEPIQSQQPKHPQESGDFIMGPGTSQINNSDFILGPAGLNGKKNKAERHPYDIF
jgi:hypothetical protein